MVSSSLLQAGSLVPLTTFNCETRGFNDIVAQAGIATPCEDVTIILAGCGTKMARAIQGASREATFPERTLQMQT